MTRGSASARKKNGVLPGQDVKKLLEENDEDKTESSNYLKVTNRLTRKSPSPFQDVPQIIKPIQIKLELDLMSFVLFTVALATRLYRLDEPRKIVFDELHYGKYVSLYMKNTFFFDAHPPLGKLLVAGVASLAGFNGSWKLDRIGAAYPSDTPLYLLRLMPAICGSLIVPTAYHILLLLGLRQSTAIIGGFLILCDNALLTQSRFILMESMLLFFGLFGVLAALKASRFRERPLAPGRWIWFAVASVSLTCAVCVKYVGVFSYLLGMYIIARDAWRLIGDRNLTARYLTGLLGSQAAYIFFISSAVYLSVFYVHLSLLTKAGPHDSVMTSAFQASLEGGLASITRGQPLVVAHGSQVTLRHTHGRTCWLHSHAHVYPVRYSDNRGSSHQQQVTCYSFKDVNNWWILKRPTRNDLVVSQPVDAIKHGDVIQLVHGITSRALNSHDVAAPVSPQNQEVSCYIDYNVSMPAQNLWKVDIVNREEVGDTWHTIQSQVRLVHVDSSQALKFSGRQLPEWGFNQHEVVTDRVINQLDTVWNVEEHRYTKNEDHRERELELVNAEMIPLQSTALGFWPKFLELQYKMLFGHQETLQSHMYASEPIEWPLVTRTVAYWIDSKSSAQIHLIGNLVIWASGVVGIVIYVTLLTIYLLRRRRNFYDVTKDEWSRFESLGQILLLGFFLHYLPYFFMERTLFLYHYLPALVFKILLLTGLLQHFLFISEKQLGWFKVSAILKGLIAVWCICVVWAFQRMTALSYGLTPLSSADLISLRWRESWDFIFLRDSS